MVVGCYCCCIVTGSHTLKPGGCDIAVVSVDAQKQQVTGWLNNKGGLSERFGGSRNYFVARFNQTFTVRTAVVAVVATVVVVVVVVAIIVAVVMLCQGVMI